MNTIAPRHLFSEIQQLIEQSRGNVAKTVNAEMTMLYWNIGKRINAHILNNERAEYGKQVVANLAKQLQDEYGTGWGEKHLRHCLHFANTFTEEEIVYTLCRELTWSHLRMIMFIDDDLKRSFYIEMCKMDNWSVRTLTRLPFLITAHCKPKTHKKRRPEIEAPYVQSYFVILIS